MRGPVNVPGASAADLAKVKQTANTALEKANEALLSPGLRTVILADQETGEKYALVMENGRLKVLGVSTTLDAAETTLIDCITGQSYTLAIEGGRIVYA